MPLDGLMINNHHSPFSYRWNWNRCSEYYGLYSNQYSQRIVPFDNEKCIIIEFGNKCVGKVDELWKGFNSTALYNFFFLCFILFCFVVSVLSLYINDWEGNGDLGHTVERLTAMRRKIVAISPEVIQMLVRFLRGKLKSRTHNY